MAMVLEKFNIVFEKLNLPDPLVQAFWTAEVSAVKIRQKEKCLSISLSMKEVPPETEFARLEQVLLEKYPFVERVEIKRQYMIEGSDEEKIRRLWPGLVARVKAESPLCGAVLENADYNAGDGRLTASISGNSKFLLEKRGVAHRLETILLDELNLSVKVFWMEEQNKKSKQDYEETVAKRETQAVREAILEANTRPAENKPREPKRLSVGGSAGGGAPKNGAFPKRRAGSRGLKLSDSISGVLTHLDEALEQDDEILVAGKIFRVEKRETKSGKLLVTFDMTDGAGSVTIKLFADPQAYQEGFDALIKEGNGIKVYGKAQYDSFSHEVNIMANEVCPYALENQKRMDNAEEKRVELHLHTNMSSMDAVTTAKTYIKRAQEWGHKAIAITDHGVVQAFPEAMETAKGTDVKVIYGVEAYLVDDLSAVAAKREGGRDLSGPYVAFDFETTGLDSGRCKIIEIGAVKIENGAITDTFSALIDPNEPLQEKIKELTGITDEMLRGKPSIQEVLPEFIDFIGDSVLVAHNAEFDMGFLESWGTKLGFDVKNPYVCSMLLGRALYPGLTNHKLNTLAKHLSVSLENHHRAVDDAKACGEIFLHMLEALAEKEITTLAEISLFTAKNVDYRKLKTYHAVILVQNQTGLRNLYELISKSHLETFYRRPRMLKSQFQRLREGLLIGTACDAGEFYRAVLENKSKEHIDKLAEFYDYFEIQPIGNTMYLFRDGHVSSEDDLRDINRKIVAYGKEYHKPVVATCDVHFIDPQDSVYRRILMTAEKFKDAANQPPLFYRTTEEMLKEFAYLGEDDAKEVVISATNQIADMIDNVKPIPDETFPPQIPGAEEELTEITMSKAKEIYGDPLPPLIASRLERELSSIIKNGFSVMYIIAQKLVWDSVAHGYLVGSRGSVGSSFVATMAGITEVNPLPPHYYCTACKYVDFDSEDVKAYAGASGCDMPEKTCPQCGKPLLKDGHDIPFETFLGFDGDKEPDIDLNFSGEYQAKAHAYTEELFGKGFVFKAGTIGTIADKTAFGFVKKYLEENGRTERNAEINRLAMGCTGIKRTTGQHPGGLMIVPNDHSIYEFCPVQHPANDANSGVVTTHFDYHSISGRLLKLDILGHDVPTIIRMLHDMTGIDPRTVDLGDRDVMSLFTSPAALGVSAEAIKCKTGTLGLPEFGTSFVRQMLLDTRPSTFAELVRISGLSHGTDVWFNNAQDLIKEGTATLKEVIPTRDDIMVYLINKGVEKKAAFKIMENVRKGKGLKPDEEETMVAANVPEWYIESCKRIKYMFPKGHAVAYVMNTVRIGYFKIHHPYAFYAAMFHVKVLDFDYDVMCKGKEKVLQKMSDIQNMGNDATAKDKNMLTTLELVLEMYARGLTFAPMDIYKSDASRFLVTDEGLLPPLCTIAGLGVNAAQTVVDARADGEFFSVEEFRERTKINKTVLELLRENGMFAGIPETAQLSFI